MEFRKILKTEESLSFVLMSNESCPESNGDKDGYMDKYGNNFGYCSRTNDYSGCGRAR